MTNRSIRQSAHLGGRLRRPTPGNCRSPLLLALALLLLVAGTLGAVPPKAVAKQVRVLEGTFGASNQPTFGRVGVLTVDPSNGDLLVLDHVDETISRFHPDGTPHDFPALGTHVVDGAGGGNCPATPADCDQTPINGLNFDGGFTNLTTQLAIDDSNTITDGNIYVNQISGNAVYAFAADGHYLGQVTHAGAQPLQPDVCGVAVDQAGTLFIADNGAVDQIYKFTPSGNPPLSGDLTASFSFQNPCSLAAGFGPSVGSLFVGTFSSRISKIDSLTGALDYVVDSNQSANGSQSVVSVNPANGNVFVVKGFLAGGGVWEYDASGPAPVLESTISVNTKSVAAAPDNRLYVVAGDHVEDHVEVYSPPVPVPDVVASPATITGLDTATLDGTVNPDGALTTDCHFSYLTDAAFQANPPNDRFAGATQVPCAESSGTIGAGTDPVPVHADIAGLAIPGVVYRFRLTAASANGSASTPDRTFSTPDKPSIKDTWTDDVTRSSAKLAARINPQNVATTFRFEYGTVGPCSVPANGCTSQPEPDEPVGSDDADHLVESTLSDLDLDTTYHYRVVATNSLGTAEGPDHAFHTFPEAAPPNTDCPNQEFRTGAAAHLPDCRAYEQVSPRDKNGGEIFPTSELATSRALNMAAPNGDAFTFSTRAAYFADPQGAPLAPQYLSDRNDDGWETRALSPPRTSVGYYDVGQTNVQPFRAVSEDLCHAWALQDSPPLLAPEAQPGFPNLYRRSNCGAQADTYEAITRVSPPGFIPDGPSGYVPFPQAFTEDGELTVFRANAKLTPDASTKDIYQTYAYRDGQLRLVSVLPNGAAAETHSSAGTGLQRSFDVDTDSVYHAVSDDGTRIFWTDSTTDEASTANGKTLAISSGKGAGHVYVRIDPDPNFDGDELTTEVSQSVSEDDAVFQAANPAGTEALFTVGGSASSDLYSFDVDAEVPTLIAPGVVGWVGAAENLSMIYFVSEAVLNGGASPGEPNLYLWEEGVGHRFIATLSELDREWGLNPVVGLSSMHQFPGWRLSRVTPDGRHLAFTSSAPLTGADNRDRVSGERVTEIFIYDAAANGGDGDLHCASCNPTGARPNGRRIPSSDSVTPDLWVSARLRGWANRNQPLRQLSDDGARLHFESTDRLTADDTNDRQDVYQWELVGTGDCDPVVSPASGGCVTLISSGESPQDSYLLDATPSGSDVFFTTSESLVAGDLEASDVYDARVGGGFPQPEADPEPCEGEGCRGAGPAAPGDVGAGSAAFLGPPNPGPRPDCSRLSRAAKRLRGQARSLRTRSRKLVRAARRSSSPKRSKAMRGQAKRLAATAKKRSRAARKQAGRAKRCRRAER